MSIQIRKNTLNVIVLVIGIAMYGIMVWQHDILVAPRIADFYTGQFEWFTGIRTSVDAAYNYTLVLQTVGLAVALLSIWFWQENGTIKSTTSSTSATPNTSGFTLKKLSPLQGIIAATVILAILGGVLQELSVWATTADLSFMGNFEVAFRSFLANSWIVVGITWIYNIFLYLRMTQTQVQDELKKYNITKMTSTLTWFIGTMGAVLAFAPTQDIKAVGAMAVFIATVILKELQNIFGKVPTATAPTSPT